MLGWVKWRSCTELMSIVGLGWVELRSLVSMDWVECGFVELGWIELILT